MRLSGVQFHYSVGMNITNDLSQPDGCDIIIGGGAKWVPIDA